MLRNYTVNIVQCEGWYAGFVEELPGAHTQGKTIAEVKENIPEAIRLVLKANRRHLLDSTPEAKIVDITQVAVDI